MDKTTLKSYFLRGKKPTEQQFATLIDSFRHIDDKIFTSSIEGYEPSDNRIYARTNGDWVENSAKNTSYDNTLTSLPANDAQGAIDALLLELQTLIQ